MKKAIKFFVSYVFAFMVCVIILAPICLLIAVILLRINDFLKGIL